MSDEQDSPISLSDDADVIEQYKLDLQSEVIRITLEEIEQRVGAGEEISDEEKEKMIEDNLKKVLQNAETSPPPDFHKTLNMYLIFLAVIGCVFAFIGYHLSPDSCASDEDTIWEELGVPLFYVSALGVPMNIVFCLISLKNPNLDSKEIFRWTRIHAIAIVICWVIFWEYITQDMFCGCWGICGMGTGWGG